MPKPVQRPSLVTETAACVREAIRRGEYRGQLPAERKLSQTLNVSRSTLRAALALLAQEGLLETKGRRPRTVAASSKRPKRTPQRPKTVRLLMIDAASARQATNFGRWYLLSKHLAEAGWTFQIEPFPAFFSSKPSHLLERIVGRSEAGLWLLQSCPEAVQRWFWERKLPCMVLGSTFPGIDFVSVDTDMRALGRHAAGTLVARGHRSLALLHSQQLFAGDQQLVAGFTEGVRTSTRKDLTCIRVPLEDDLSQSVVTLEKLMAHPGKPDGWLALGARVYLTAFSFLNRQRLQAGKDISLICSDSEQYFSALIPSPAVYERNNAARNRLILRVIQTVLGGGWPEKKNHLLQAGFQDGGSLRPFSPEIRK